jgi:transcriptional regulator with XRE-family HTH domain
VVRQAGRDLNVAFGEVVHTLRKERGLSQEAFAELVGWHRNFVGGVERGERNVSLASVERLARALDLTASELIARAEGRR